MTTSFPDHLHLTLKPLCIQTALNTGNRLYEAVCSSDTEMLSETLKSGRATHLDFMHIYFESQLFPTTIVKRPKMFKDEWTALHLAVYHGKSEMVKLLLEQHHARVNGHSIVFLLSPLMVAIGKGHHNIMKLLLAHGADANDNTGRQVPLLVHLLKY